MNVDEAKVGDEFPWQFYREMAPEDVMPGMEHDWLFVASVDHIAERGCNASSAIIRAYSLLPPERRVEVDRADVAHWGERRKKQLLTDGAACAKHMARKNRSVERDGLPRIHGVTSKPSLKTPLQGDGRGHAQEEGRRRSEPKKQHTGTFFIRARVLGKERAEQMAREDVRKLREMRAKRANGDNGVPAHNDTGGVIMKRTDTAFAEWKVKVIQEDYEGAKALCMRLAEEAKQEAEAAMAEAKAWAKRVKVVETFETLEQ